MVKGYDLFENTFLEILDEHALVKKKLLRANYTLYMSQALKKVIMKRSELKSKYFKNQAAYDFEWYKKNRKTIVANCQKKKERDITIT